MKKSKKEVATKPVTATERTSAVIRMEYLQECSRAGEIQYRLVNDPDLLKETNEKIKKLHSEFNRVAAVEQAAQAPANV
jgi:hypothetical protein